eukprot:TRINITY_DN18729_c0_g1_i1.p2 TRINITY_DN18729_c0_g1~~TRINITY_DN18729_c0_g1_i1.p2  ORF type:complete len:149 (+),score=21.48 TRINITY_DN18729_c0_g1_i1:184-630(+)
MRLRAGALQLSCILAALLQLFHEGALRLRLSAFAAARGAASPPGQQAAPHAAGQRRQRPGAGQADQGSAQQRKRPHRTPQRQRGRGTAALSWVDQLNVIDGQRQRDGRTPIDLPAGWLRAAFEDPSKPLHIDLGCARGDFCLDYCAVR